MDLFTKQKQSHKSRKQTYGWQSEGGRNEKIRTAISTPVYKKQITNKDLMYSTENYIQYSVMTYIGKESEKQWIHVLIYV